MTIIVSKNNPNFLVMIDTKFDDEGFAVAGESRVGAIQWDESKFSSASEALEAAKQREWKLVEREDSDFYNVVAL